MEKTVTADTNEGEIGTTVEVRPQRRFQAAVWTTGPVSPNFNDWPAQMQDQALEAVAELGRRLGIRHLFFRAVEPGFDEDRQCFYVVLHVVEQVDFDEVLKNLPREGNRDPKKPIIIG